MNEENSVVSNDKESFKFDYLRMPRLIFYNKDFTIQQKILLSILYHLMLTLNNNGCKATEDKLTKGVSIKELELSRLSNLNMYDVRECLSYFTRHHIITKTFNSKTKEVVYAASTHEDCTFSLLSINMKKLKDDSYSGYLVMPSYILYDNDLTLLDRIICTLAIACAKNNTELYIHRKHSTLATYFAADITSFDTIANSLKYLMQKSLISVESNEEYGDFAVSFNLDRFEPKKEEQPKDFLIVPNEILELNTTPHNKIILAKLLKAYKCSSKSTQSKGFDLSLDTESYYAKMKIPLSKLRKMKQSFIEMGLFTSSGNILLPTDKFKNLSYKKNFLRIPKEILESNVSDSNKLVFSYFMNFSKNDQKCFSKYDNICSHLGISKVALYKVLAEMKANNLVELDKKILKNGKVGREIKANVVKINTYCTNISKAEKVRVSAQNNNIEKAENVSINAENSSIEKIENANIANISMSVESTLSLLTEEALTKLYQKCLDNIHNNNQNIQKEGE